MGIKTTLMKKVFFLQIALIFILSLIGCDPVSDFRKIVENKSEYKIAIIGYYRGQPGQPYDTVYVDAHEEVRLRDAAGEGGLGGPPGCVSVIDSQVCKVFDRPDLIVSKDLNNSDNWTSTTSGSKKKGYSKKCVAIITDADIVSQ